MHRIPRKDHTHCTSCCVEAAACVMQAARNILRRAGDEAHVSGQCELGMLQCQWFNLGRHTLRLMSLIYVFVQANKTFAFRRKLIAATHA